MIQIKFSASCTGFKIKIFFFYTGLDTHQVLSLLRQDRNIASGRTLFSGRVKPLTANAVRNHLKFNYSNGNEALDQRTTGQGFLTFLQATKGEEM